MTKVYYTFRTNISCVAIDEHVIVVVLPFAGHHWWPVKEMENRIGSIKCDEDEVELVAIDAMQYTGSQIPANLFT